MKKMNKKAQGWFGIILIILIIIFIGWYYDFGGIKTYLDNATSSSKLDIAMNPEKYEGEEVSIRNVYVNDWKNKGDKRFYVMVIKKEDGNYAHLDISYRDRLRINYDYDLKGVIKKHEDGSYYLDITRAIIRD